MPDKVSTKLTAISPAVFFCKIINVLPKLCTGKFCLFTKPTFSFMPCPLNITFQFVFVGVRTNYICSAKVSFPIFKYRPEVQEKNIVFLYNQVRWIFIIRHEGIYSCPHNSFVPVFFYSEKLKSKVINFGIKLFLGLT